MNRVACLFFAMISPSGQVYAISKCETGARTCLSWHAIVFPITALSLMLYFILSIKNSKLHKLWKYGLSVAIVTVTLLAVIASIGLMSIFAHCSMTCWYSGS